MSLLSASSEIPIVPLPTTTMQYNPTSSESTQPVLQLVRSMILLVMVAVFLHFARQVC